MQVYLTLLAILKTGAAYVPIDPGYPVDRVSYILGDAKCPILLTSVALPIYQDIFMRHQQYVPMFDVHKHACACVCMYAYVCVCACVFVCMCVKVCWMIDSLFFYFFVVSNVFSDCTPVLC